MTQDKGYNSLGWLIWLECGWQQWCQACIEDDVPNTLARWDWHDIVVEMGRDGWHDAE